MRRGTRRVDRRGGPGRGGAARGGAGLARRGGRRVAARHRHLGGGGARRAVRPQAMALLRPGRDAAPRRTEAAAGHSYGQRLAAARLELCAVRGRPRGRRRPGRRPRHGGGGRRGSRAGTGGRLPESAGGAAGAAAPADALPRGPRGRGGRGAEGAVGGCGAGHRAGRTGGSGAVRAQDGGSRRCRCRPRPGRGAAPGRPAGVAGVVAAGRGAAARGAQRRERGPARAHGGRDPAPAGRPRTGLPGNAVEESSGAGAGRRPQGRPPRQRPPGPRALRPDPAPSRDRPGRRGEPVRAPRGEHAHPPAGFGGGGVAHGRGRVGGRHGKRLAAARVPGRSAPSPVRPYRARPLCLPTTRQRDRMRFRQSRPNNHSTGVHQPCSVADGGWIRREAPVPRHPRH